MGQDCNSTVKLETGTPRTRTTNESLLCRCCWYVEHSSASKTLGPGLPGGSHARSRRCSQPPNCGSPPRYRVCVHEKSLLLSGPSSMPGEQLVINHLK